MGLILIQGFPFTMFFRNCYFLCGSSRMYYHLVGPFPQSSFRPCYLGCETKRLCLKNSLGSEVSPHLHACVIVGVLSHDLIFHFII